MGVEDEKVMYMRLNYEYPLNQSCIGNFPNLKDRIPSETEFILVVYILVHNRGPESFIGG
jgi:hypothetical protein